MNQPKKLISLLGLFIIIGLVSGCLGGTEVAPSTQDTAKDSASTAQPDKSAEPAKAAETATRTSINEVLLDEKISFDSFPLERSMELKEGLVYAARFSSDEPIQFVVYSERRYNEWKEGGYHTISKVTTKSGTKCCDTDYGTSFDINNGEGGLYYFVFDDSLLVDNDPRPTTGSLKVTLASNI